MGSADLPSPNRIEIQKHSSWEKTDMGIAHQNQLILKAKPIHWLLEGSKLSIENQLLLLYKAVLKPVWTSVIQRWGTASNSIVEILQHFQSKALRSILNTYWYRYNQS